MRQKERGGCFDATVKRETECTTDHQLLCVKVKMGRKHYHPRRSFTKQKKVWCFQIIGKQQRRRWWSEWTNSAGSTIFQELAAEKTINAWPSGGTVSEKWLVMKSALIELATASLRIEKQCHPGKALIPLNLRFNIGTKCTTSGSLQSALKTTLCAGLWRCLEYLTWSLTSFSHFMKACRHECGWIESCWKWLLWRTVRGKVGQWNLFYSISMHVWL